MHARLVTLQIRPGKAEGALQIYRQRVVPVLRELPGCAGARWLTDVQQGRAILMTTWETQASMTATEASGLLSELLARFQPVLAAPPRAEQYEVCAEDVFPVVADGAGQELAALEPSGAG